MLRRTHPILDNLEIRITTSAAEDGCIHGRQVLGTELEGYSEGRGSTILLLFFRASNLWLALGRQSTAPKQVKDDQEGRPKERGTSEGG